MQYMTDNTRICEACDGNSFVRKLSNNRWVDRFLHMARNIAHWSKDPRTIVGAVAVNKANSIVETGYNGIPRGVKDLPERMTPEAKKYWVSHAEENLIANAARPRLEGTTVFVTHFCCTCCARMIIQSGVSRVIVGNGKWSAIDEHAPIVRTMFEEAGVTLQFGSEVDA